MKTYQDLKAVGDSESARMSFIESAISEHKTSCKYEIAVDALKYYDGENPTIERYEKLIYDALGKAHINRWTANHKIATHFFKFAVDQSVSYLLGNGVNINSDRLSKDFDQSVFEIATNAQVGGVAFGFPELQKYSEGEPEKYKLRYFSITEFVPLYDENNGALRAGIRFWQVSSDKPMRATLYEEDGYTEYLKSENKPFAVMQDKMPYKITVRKTEIDGTEILNGENYPGFPIVPLMNNENQNSEIVGKRGTIDALDLITSGMVNNTDEGTLLYWILPDRGGMNSLDDAKFLDELKITHVLHIDSDEKAEPHTLEQPVDSSQATIDMLSKRLYEDFQAFDVSQVTAGNQTATAIKASYVPLDLKTDRFEMQVTKFILEILRLIGVNDEEPTYTRNVIINKSEEIQSLMMASQYLSEEYITEKVLTILGDADKLEEVSRQIINTSVQRFGGGADESDWN